jgi:hypothetical protein
MGCDIHIRIERKTDEGWKTVEPPPYADDSFWTERRYRGWFYDRNYALFGVLADVRGDGPAIAPPRGLPPDMERRNSVDDDPYPETEESRSRRDLYLGDHSFTWYTASELLGWPHWTNDPRLIDDEARWTERWTEWMERDLRPLAEEHGGDNVRVIMGFDS